MPEGSLNVYFFVKSHLPADKVNDFTSKLANREVCAVEGNVSYVTTDGCVGYDIVECRDETDCRRKYEDLVRNGLVIDEMSRIEPMGQFIEAWKRGRERAA